MTPKQPVGNYIVYPTASARHQAWDLCGLKAGEVWKLRKHAFKLAYWPDSSEEAQADLDWDWLSGYRHLNLGELRIDEPINGKSNIRVIFFKATQLLGKETLPRIWLLSVFAKKRQDFGNGQLSAFKGMRTLILEREYDGAPN